ncbi:amidase [Rhizobiaceae bacterium n13]|uniref:Indoleacetamide hydrolase n=1 Tax=Ferirhizobium litorale TaxID=2927786 RepID=A0AAE3U498_9HYPH|nr:amidase [Fererhizobium litorale]MDI7863134.1 amidase [Fererhizobium litorale]MDI7923188.1 amidase [Fererhizobium litorale]
MAPATRPTRDRLEQTLAQLDARAGRERAFVKLYPASARAEADSSDRRMREGRSLGPLDGKIVSIKDLFDIAGEQTLAGSIIRRAAPVAPADAAIVRRLRAAGAVIIGKTHMTEFAFTAVGLNPHHPVPGNAIDPALVPGGSSSGAGVSVAEGTCDIAIGSDTGGSVRIPAALNGVCGFKPTAARIPLAGAFPLSPSLDSIGPLAHTVAECAIADAVMAGDLPQPVVQLQLSGLRVAVPSGRLMEQLDPTIESAFAGTCRRLEKAGVQISDIHIDDLLETLAEATRIGSIAGIEASRIHADWLADASAPVDGRVASSLRRRLLVPQAAADALLATRRELVRAMDERLSAVDIVLLPTTPIGAVPIATVSADETTYQHVEGLLLRNTQVANQFDLTAITLPMPALARPAGAMLMGRNQTDGFLLRAASAVEALLRAS